MLEITVPGEEAYDEISQLFTTVGDTTLQLEHSLISLSKWESEFQKPFLSSDEKTSEETDAYIKAMVLTPDFPPEVLSRLSSKNYEQINEYIGNKMSATWFTELPGAPKSSEAITSELIYYWLVSFGIPFEVQTWHLNRLLTLVRVCNVKSQKPQKMTREQIAARNRELNAQRRAQLGTRG